MSHASETLEALAGRIARSEDRMARAGEAWARMPGFSELHSLAWKSWLGQLRFAGPVPGWDPALGRGPDRRPPPTRRGAYGRGLGETYPTRLLETLRGMWTGAVRGLRAVSDAAELESLARRIEEGPAPALADTPARSVLAAGCTQLLRARAARRSAGQGAPLLLLPSPVNRHYVLDLMPGSSLLEAVNQRGTPTYLLDWGLPGPGERDLSLDDLVLTRLRGAAARIQEEHGRAPIAVGYCMGGTLAAMLEAVEPGSFSGLALLAAPMDFSRGGRLAEWGDPELTDVDLVADSFERVPGALVHTPFRWLRPTVDMAKLSRLLRLAAHPGAEQVFMALELWTHDQPDMPVEVYRRWARDLYQENRFLAGELSLGGAPARPESIQAPCLIVAADGDVITPPDCAEALAPHLAPDRVHVTRASGGHIGMLIGPRVRHDLYTTLNGWLDSQEPARGTTPRRRRRAKTKGRRP